MKRTSSRDLRQAALAYAERGWPVLPLVPGNKRPLTKNGLLDATENTQVISIWWSRWPTANIGIRTGVAFDVLDIDGEVGLASLSAKTGPGVVHPGPVSRTGRGLHWLYIPTYTKNWARPDLKLDWRGLNGYIVAPPSVHPEGGIYEWEQGPDYPMPPVPEWLEEMLLAPKTSTHPIIDIDPNDPNRDILLAAEFIGLGVTTGTLRRALCPFHEEDTPSFTLYPEQGRFFCYGCGAWGDAFDLRNRRYGGKW